MKKFYLICFSHCAFCIVHCESVFAPNPLIKNCDARFGGNESDYITGLMQTSDGGYMLSGYTTSDSSGDKSQNTKTGNDYWIVKLDAAGVKQWDKDFGGFDFDVLFSADQTSDGGYI